MPGKYASCTNDVDSFAGIQSERDARHQPMNIEPNTVFMLVYLATGETGDD